jgi:hypothetical protein
MNVLLNLLLLLMPGMAPRDAVLERGKEERRIVRPSRQFGDPFLMPISKSDGVSRLNVDSGQCGSPVILDLWGRGFELTDQAVKFDLNANYSAESTMWTKGHAGVALLALDRDRNGMIDNGRELFGDHTPLMSGAMAALGYDALAEFDQAFWGGNFDGYISPVDTIWPELRLWLDDNHNGLSEPDELLTLDQAGVLSLEYDYRLMWRVDRFGNLFRARSRALIQGRNGRPQTRRTYDVFFVRVGE